MTYSQKYSIVQFLESVDEGKVYSMDNWPLHTTLADVFAVDLNEDFIRKLNAFLASASHVEISAQSDTTLGSAENPIHVTLLNKTLELQLLHDKLVNFLSENGAVFNSPQFTHEGFLPHSTIQQNGRIHAGDRFVIDELSIIDMFVDGDWQKRKVLKKIKLSSL